MGWFSKPDPEGGKVYGLNDRQHRQWARRERITSDRQARYEAMKDRQARGRAARKK